MHSIVKSYNPNGISKSRASLLILFFALHLTVAAYPDPECTSYVQSPYLVKEFIIDGAGVLKAFTFAGNIEVRSIRESNKVRVELYVERGYAFWSGSKNLDNYRINIFQRGNEVIASVEQKKKDIGFFSDQVTFSYKIYVPEMMSTELKTLGGHIRMSGLRGDQLAKTGGGNIQLTDLSGHIGAYTSGGTIQITRNKGTIFAQTHGGNIHVEHSEGELRLKTAGGNIISHQTSGSFVAKTEAGNIQAQFVSAGKGISIETTAGNIYAKLPSQTGFNLFATANQIDLAEAENFYGEKSTSRVEGRLNEGGIPLRLQSSSGTITIKTE